MGVYLIVSSPRTFSYTIPKPPMTDKQEPPEWKKKEIAEVHEQIEEEFDWELYCIGEVDY